MPAPVLRDIVRQHAEQAAFLWTLYDRVKRYPDEYPEMDEERIARLVERLKAHLVGLRVAGEEGQRIAGERYAEFPEGGELFVVRMLQPGPSEFLVEELDLGQEKGHLAANVGTASTD